MQQIAIPVIPAQTCGDCAHFEACEAATADGFQNTPDTPSGQVTPIDPACEHFEVRKND